ncbi:hypothetical protein KD4_07700 [Yersinia pseudotuberculosis]
MRLPEGVPFKSPGHWHVAQNNVYSEDDSRPLKHLIAIYTDPNFGSLQVLTDISMESVG